MPNLNELSIIILYYDKYHKCLLANVLAVSRLRKTEVLLELACARTSYEECILWLRGSYYIENIKEILSIQK